MKIGRRHQWERTVRGWWFCLCYGQLWGIGLLWHGRYNGIAIHLGPFSFDIAPPPPKELATTVKSANDDSMTTVT
jgi:hypothetical protein